MDHSGQPQSQKPEERLTTISQVSMSPAQSHSSDGPDASRDSSPSIDKEPEYLAGVKLYTLFLALILFILMIALDAAIVSTALPRITDDFHSITNIGWYGAAYMIANSSLQPLTGKVYKYGPLKISLFAFVVLFELGSVLCATARSSMMFIIGRAVAGLGGAGVSSGSLVLISQAAPPAQRPTIMGVVMSMFGMGQLLGPLVGGLVTQYASWRWCFWINLPIGGAAAAAIFAVALPLQVERPKLTRANFLQNFDVVGFLFFAPASIMLLIALQSGGTEYVWSSATVIGLLCGAMATYVVFAFWERHQGDDAMFPASLLRQAVFSCSMAFSFLFGASLLELAYCLPLWFQVVKHNSPSASGVHTLPTFLSQILFSIISGPLSTRIGFFSPLALVGASVAATGTGLITTFNAATPAAKWIGFQLLSGSGRGMAFQQPINTAQATLSKAMMPTGLSVIIWAQFFGGAVSLALGQTMLTSLLRPALEKFAPDINPEVVIHAGATNFAAVVPASALREVELAYNQAITRTIFLPTGLAVAAALMTLGMGWKRIVKVKESRNEAVVGEEEQKI